MLKVTVDSSTLRSYMSNISDNHVLFSVGLTEVRGVHAVVGTPSSREPFRRSPPVTAFAHFNVSI